MDLNKVRDKIEEEVLKIMAEEIIIHQSKIDKGLEDGEEMEAQEQETNLIEEIVVKTEDRILKTLQAHLTKEDLEMEILDSPLDALVLYTLSPVDLHPEEVLLDHLEAMKIQDALLIVQTLQEISTLNCPTRVEAA